MMNVENRIAEHERFIIDNENSRTRQITNKESK